MDIATIDFSNILSWIVFGLISGYVAHLIDPADVSGGLLATTVTGIVGALVGGIISYSLFGITVTGFNIASLIIAVVGALVFAFLYRLVFRKEGIGVGGYGQYGTKGGTSRKENK